MNKNTEWKSKFTEIVQTCQSELKRTTDIGKRMLSASKTNTTLHESYEEIGTLVVKALKNGELQWDNPRVNEILNTIKGCEKDLELMEKEVNHIRFSESDKDTTTKS